MRRHQPRISNIWAGVIAAVVILAACYLVFGGSLPFSGSPFMLKAAFTSQTELHIPSAVRVAGVDVGQVVSVKRVSNSSNAALITMDINSNGLPIHQDATVRIRPRLFLEGNFYVDLQPGSPNAPILKSGSTLPVANTAGPVQLDRVLSALRSDTRTNLQTLLQGYGASLNAPPTGAEDATQDPLVRGLTGAQSLNESLRFSAQAFKASTIVNQALLGLKPHDLSGVVVGNSRVFTALASTQNVLASFVTTFNATMGTLASRQQDLSQTIAALPPLLRNADSSDTALDASFAPTRAFARALLPSIKQLDPTIGAGLPWLKQSSALLSKSELGGLLNLLTPAIQNTASSLGSTKAFIRSNDLLTRCFLHNIIPTGDAKISDPPIGTGLAVYQELFQSAVGIAGSAQNFDGNGRYVRAMATGGADRVKTANLPGSGPLYGNAVAAPLGTRPAFPGALPPLRSNVACFKNQPPNLNNAQTGSGP